MSDIKHWLTSIELHKYADAFEANDIDLSLVPDLDHDALREIGVTSIGHRIKLLKAAESLPQTGTGPHDNIESGAQRRSITVMFCDMVGSTNLSVRLDPEDLSELIDYYRSISTTVIEENGGYIARYFGDGVLVYFGYPQAYEDDPERAVRAGLQIIDALAGYKNPQGIGIQVRVGIANGDVVVGELIGSGEAMERNVVGETPNLAARLQSHANPNTVVVSSRLYRLVAGLFEFADLGKIEFKGFDQSLNTWQVLGHKKISSRFQATQHQYPMSPFTGRTSDLDQVRTQWQLAQHNKGQTVLITGEPGIGKSRLLETALSEFSTDSPSIVRYNCMPSSSNSSLRPVINQLLMAAEINNKDADKAKLNKLQTLLCNYLNDDEVDLIAHMLSLPPREDRAQPTRTPQAQKAMALDAVCHYLILLSNESPLIIVLEDLHWTDPSTLEFFNLLLSQLEDQRILVLMTSRDEFDPSALEDGKFLTLPLDRLSISEARVFLESISGQKLPSPVLDEILVKADGNPLFIEELARSAMDNDTAADQPARQSMESIPESLQASLISRLDRLGSAKTLAQICSVIGRHFTVDLVCDVTTMARDALIKELQKLARADLIYPMNGNTALATTYSFKHALIQDTAYATMLRTRRYELHSKIATVLRQDKTILQTQPEQIAQHLTKANELVESIEYWRIAGLISMGKFSNKEAISHFENGLKAVAAIDDPARRCGEELALTVLSTVPKMLTQGWGAAEVKAGYERARNLCDLVGGDAPKELFSTRSGLGSYYIVTGNWTEANRIVGQNLEMAKSYNLPEMLCEANTEMGVVALYSQNSNAALPFLQTAIDKFDSKDTPKHLLQYGRHPLVVSYVTRAMANWAIGHADKARNDSQAAMRIVEETPHPFSKAWAMAGTAIVSILNGEITQAQNVSSEICQHAKTQHFPYWLANGLVFRGWANLLNNEDNENALVDIEQGLHIWNATGTRMITPLLNTPHILGLMKLQRYSDAEKSLARQFEYIASSGENWWAPEIHRCKGLLFEEQYGTGTDQALQAATTAYDLAAHCGAWGMALRAANDVARHYLHNDRADEVTAMLGPLYSRLAPHATGTNDIETAKKHLSKA